MNPKILKLRGEIDKTRTKISDLQGRLRSMEQQKTELENAEIVAVVRGLGSLPENLDELVATLRGTGLPGKPAAPSAPPAAATPFSTTPQATKEDLDDEE